MRKVIVLKIEERDIPDFGTESERSLVRKWVFPADDTGLQAREKLDNFMVKARELLGLRPGG